MTAPNVDNSIVCPLCSGPMWNERAGKYWGTGLTATGKKKPTFKCKNKACGGALWIEPPTSGPALVQSAPAPTAAPPASPAVEQGSNPSLPKPSLAQIYITCTDFVLATIVPKYEAKEIGCTPEAIASMVATIFIARTREG